MLYSEKEIFLKYGVAIIADDSSETIGFLIYFAISRQFLSRHVSYYMGLSETSQYMVD